MTSDDPDDQTMTIGRFARASRLSVKALRLYDESGLLRPRDVDDHTGYRHYHPDQLDRARVIAKLRELDMPLEVVSGVLDADDSAERDRRLAFWWAGQERTAAIRRDLVRSLRADLAATSATVGSTQEIAYRTVGAARVLTELGSTSVGELPGFIGGTIGRLRAVSDAVSSDSVVVIYHGRVNVDSDGPIEVCVPVADDRTVDADRLPTGVNLRSTDAHREAYLTLTKSQLVYPDVLAAYDRIEAHLRATGDVAAGPPREYYFTDLRAAGPDDPVCHAAVPVR